MPDNVAQRASDADKFWAPTTHFVDADPARPRSLRGMYRTIFRGLHAHAAVASVEPYIILERATADRT